MVGRIFGSGISVCTEPSSFFSLVSYGIENQLYIQTESRKWTILASREAQLLTNFILDLILSLSSDVGPMSACPHKHDTLQRIFQHIWSYNCKTD